MQEKELRFALVCFGGVSLAVYMHGVTKEILKLVRASSALHAERGPARGAASFFDARDRADPEHDTEAVYFDLLREIGRTLDLRVVVDVIAGASAGGINAAMLARALSHDLPMGALRDLWLERADIDQLLAPEARAGAWSKWFLKPVIWALGTLRTSEPIDDPEVRRKLSLFVRSRWFKPPLSGARMTEFLHDAMVTMGPPRDRQASLLPSGQKLDLFVTLTDHYGYRQPIRIHQPPLIHEHEHRHILHFRYKRRASGTVESDFDLDGVPALTFAARATSSFPGMFPPAQVAEIDRLLAARGLPWPQRTRFLERNFAPYIRQNVDPASAWFVDGSVLDNRPFRQAIGAIRGRPAYRQVDRRLIYIDPDPGPPGAPVHHSEPGFFTMLWGALSDLPSTQPVTDELNWVDEFNDRVERLREIVDNARPRISGLVASIIATPFDAPLAAGEVRAWRARANLVAARDAGFAYEGYVRLKLASVRAFLSGLIARLRGAPPRSPLAYVIAETVDAWAEAAGYVYDHSATTHEETSAAGEAVPRWMAFLRAFDVDYARRRLHFMIEGQNRLYQVIDRPPFEGLDPAAVDALKRTLYDRLEALQRRARAPLDDPLSRDLAEGLFRAAPAVASGDESRRFARQFVERHRGEIDTLMSHLAETIDLGAAAGELDTLLADSAARRWHPQERREVIVGYLGFPFWDVLTFPVMADEGAGEFNRILVDRLSPQDALSLGRFGGSASLRGVGFGHFAAFFSRAYRENDYLLGRLHAFDRLVDIVCDSAGFDPDGGRLAWKKRGFRTILDAEEKHLPSSTALMAALRNQIDTMG